MEVRVPLPVVYESWKLIDAHQDCKSLEGQNVAFRHFIPTTALLSQHLLGLQVSLIHHCGQHGDCKEQPESVKDGGSDGDGWPYHLSKWSNSDYLRLSLPCRTTAKQGTFA